MLQQGATASRRAGRRYTNEYVETVGSGMTAMRGSKRRTQQFQITNHIITTDVISPLVADNGGDEVAPGEGATEASQQPAFRAEAASAAGSEHEDSDLDELFSPLHEPFSSFSEGDEDEFEFLNMSYPKRFTRQINWDASDECGASAAAGGEETYMDRASSWGPMFDSDDIIVSDSKDFWKNIETSSSVDEQLPFTDTWSWNDAPALGSSTSDALGPSIPVAAADSLEDFINSNISSDAHLPPAGDSFQYKIRKLTFRDSDGTLSLSASSSGSRNRISKKRIKRKAIRRKSAVSEMFFPGVGIGEFMLL